MNTLQKIDLWSQNHHPFWADLLRIPFGVAIILKGLFFIHNSSELVQVMQQYHLGGSYVLAYLIAWIHIIGGLFISLGLITRIAILVQLPIVFGAVFFVNAHRDMINGNGEFLFSIIVLLLLLFYLIEGAGKFSIDALIEGKTWTLDDKRGRNIS